MAEKKANQPTTSGASAADDRRENALDRRAKAERRKGTETVAKERRGAPGERRKVERRINEYRLKPEVLEFINAVNDFKSVRQKPFPTWSEIFQILMDLGYRRD